MNSTTNEEEDIILRVINYCYLVLSIVGTLANILAFIVFSRKRFANTVYSTYFRALLAADTFGLFYLAIEKFVFFEFNVNFRDLNIVLCRLTMPIAYSIPSISAYLTAMISFDRWLSISKPTVLLIRRKRKFQINVCIIIIFVNFIYNAQLFFSYLAIDPMDEKLYEVCLILNENLLSTMDLINSTIIPFILMSLFSFLTIRAVFASRNKIRQAVFNPGFASIDSEILSKLDITRKRDIKFAISSILVDIIFLLLNAPYSSFYFIIRNILNRSGDSWVYIRTILLLSFLNNASVFFISYAVNKQFKKEFLIFFSENINLNLY